MAGCPKGGARRTSVKIIKVGATVSDNNGEVRLALQGDMPDNCVAIFVKNEDYEEARDRLKED